MDLRLVFAVIAFAYITVYFAIPELPGNSPYEHPLGWWGWFDQGKYLLSANALSQLDFAPDKHFYPPLYPMLGAFFLEWSSGHMFFGLNLLCLLWVSFVFFRISDRYIPRWGSTILLFGTTIFNYTLFQNYLIPWTSTLSAALLASGFLGLVWLEEVKEGKRNGISLLKVLFVATCLGLLVPTRPADALVGAVVGVSLMLGYWSIGRENKEGVPRVTYYFVISIVGGFFGLLLLVIFNTVVFGSPIGGYMEVVSNIGFFPADLPEKFISMWLDGLTLYGEPNAGLTEQYPWLFLSLAGLLWVLIRGDVLLKTVALAVVVLFVVYLPYSDLLPNGLWRYLNIHYFKWTFPFLALFAVLLFKQVLVSWGKGGNWIMPLSLQVFVPLLLLSLHVAVDVTRVSVLPDFNEGNAVVRLPNQEKIDFVDFKGLSGEFTDVYFGSHRLRLDGRELLRVSDYRLLPMSWGVRLLFIRPVSGQSLELLPDKTLMRHGGRLSARVGSYHFAFGAVKPLRQNIQHKMVADYYPGDVIEFSQGGNGDLYVTHGWSVPEAWGRWSLDGEAGILLRVVDFSSSALELELVMGAFVSGSQPCQQVRILVNASEIASQSLCVGNGAERPSAYKFILNSEVVAADGIINIRLATPNSVSPARLGISPDDRVLGVGVSSLRLRPF